MKRLLLAFAWVCVLCMLVAFGAWPIAVALVLLALVVVTLDELLT